MMDYSNKRPVNKNRPRKQPVGILVIILFVAVSISFVSGFAAGWFLHRTDADGNPDQQRAQGPDVVDSQGQPTQPVVTAPPGADPPLTFYDTLPKGGKAILGSGLNPEIARTNEPPVPPPTVQQPVVPKAAAPSVPVKGDERKDQTRSGTDASVQQPSAAQAPGRAEKAVAEQSAPLKQPDKGGRFCVQVASSKEREEAETLRDRLAAKGLPVYVVESTVKDRGTWYRVRVGKHLSQQAAGELAAKTGNGAIVISE